MGGSLDYGNVGERQNITVFVTMLKEQAYAIPDLSPLAAHELSLWAPGAREGIPQLSLVGTDTSSSASFYWATRKIKECLDRHTECCRMDESFLPTRLINVSPATLDGDVVLEGWSARIPLETRYIALSYVWEKHEHECKTSHSTLAAQLARIPWSKLPRTFQDAVTFTRKLGISYLWIDSVCIIQGDESDWRHEAGKMFHVYKNAYLTLAAVWGTDSNSGLFSNSQKWKLDLIAEIAQRQHRWPLYTRPCHPTFYDWQPGEGVPLFSRAWAFQERLISPRVLVFAECELTFECLRGCDCECGLWQQERFEKDALKKSALFREIFDSGGKSSHTPQTSWREMVSAYSALELSVSSDRLPAIAGVAEYLQSARPSERYLAGLWSGSLHQDLLWRAPSWINKNPNSLSSIPSCSWASFPGSCQYRHDRWKMDCSNTEILQATCTYVDGNPFGILESSHLVIRAPLLGCYFQKKKKGRRAMFSNRQEVVEIHHNEAGIRITEGFDLNYASTRRFPLQVYLLEMGTMFEYHRGSAFNCLILCREDERHHVYSRVGVLQVETQKVGEELLVAFRKYGKVEACTIV